ncbi:MAG: hypothetical protein AAF639_12540 [Chloroflexota bacterium]
MASKIEPLRSEIRGHSDDQYERLSQLTRRLTQLSRELRLDELRDEFDYVDERVEGVPKDLAAIRKRGYQFGRAWEKEARNLQERWDREQDDIEELIDDTERDLRRSLRDSERIANRAERNLSLLSDFDRSLDTLNREIDQAKTRVRSRWQTTQERLATLSDGVQWAEFLLDALAEKSFDLYPNEHGVMACKAEWRNRDEEPVGILYLTDHRVIFEQKEEKAVRKFLFITRESKLVQDVLWESPIGAVETVEAEDKGGFLGINVKQLLSLGFVEDIRHAQPAVRMGVILRLRDYANNEGWQVLVEAVRSGDIENDRIDRIDHANSTNPLLFTDLSSSDLPTHCPNCETKLPTIYKGMVSVTCRHCATITNL